MAIIRSAQQSDGERVFYLVELLAKSWTPNRQAFERIFPAIIADRSTHLRVADEEGLVVAYSLAVLQWTLRANGPIVLVQELMVDPDYRSLGIGAQLLATVVNDAKLSGAMEITLASSRSKEYYSRFGFTETAGYFSLKL